MIPEVGKYNMCFFLSSQPSYLLTRYAESLGQYAAASQSCNFALRFFHSNQKDVSEKNIFLNMVLPAECTHCREYLPCVTGAQVEVYRAVLASALRP